MGERTHGAARLGIRERCRAPSEVYVAGRPNASAGAPAGQGERRQAKLCPPPGVALPKCGSNMAPAPLASALGKPDARLAGLARGWSQLRRKRLQSDGRVAAPRPPLTRETPRGLVLLSRAVSPAATACINRLHQWRVTAATGIRPSSGTTCPSIRPRSAIRGPFLGPATAHQQSAGSASAKSLAQLSDGHRHRRVASFSADGSAPLTTSPSKRRASSRAVSASKRGAPCRPDGMPPLPAAVGCGTHKKLSDGVPSDVLRNRAP